MLPIVFAALVLSPGSGQCPPLVVASPPVDKAPEFSGYRAGKPRKDAFVGYFLPIINTENSRILADRARLLCLRDNAPLAAAERHWVEQLAKHYRLAEFDITDKRHWAELLARVDAIPPSLALAQGANESAWGASRFAREGNNFFGQWCFKPGCGLVPKHRPEGAQYEVAVFKSPRLSVRSYMRNLNSHSRYAPLRALRSAHQPAGGETLAEGLLEYSARREAYIHELQNLIQYNNWAGYDRAPAGT